MKLRRFLFAFLISLAAFQFCFSQEKNVNLALLGSGTEITYEEIAAITDSLVNEAYKTPSAVGYIVIYGGTNLIDNAFYKNAVISNLRFRRIDDKKIKVITSTGTEKIKLEFWLSKDGTPPQVKLKDNNFILQTTNQAVYFADGLVVFDEIEDKQTYYFGGCEGGCIQYPSFYLISEFLKANPQLKAFVIIRGKNFKKAKAVKTAIEGNEPEDAPNRIMYLYGGKNKANENSFSEVEIYLASNENQLPQASKIKYKSLQ
ncbi:MAG: hypothetical protein M3033_17830 [Acidobacteriota bacterium]|nr:hypothetical protein [Acidobacteriota bacterium]